MGEVIARTLRLDSARVWGTVFLPGEGEPRAGLLLIGGSGGSEPSYVGKPFAEEGIAGLSVAYFGRPGLPETLREIPLEYFFAALDLLRDAVPTGTPLVVLGMSRGSEAAMLVAIHSPVPVGGVVVTVPGNIVAGSWPPGGAAWLLGGEPLPYGRGAAIRVELVPGPILLVAAGADRVWPSAEMAQAMSARLRDHGDRHGHTLLVYPDAGHSLGYLIPRLPSGLLPPDLNDRDADRAAREDALQRAIEFVRGLAGR